MEEAKAAALYLVLAVRSPYTASCESYPCSKRDDQRVSTSKLLNLIDGRMLSEVCK